MPEARMTCPDCESHLPRRNFLRQVGGTAAVGAITPLLSSLPGAYAAPTSSSAAETAVTEFFGTLSDKQRSEICFPFDHELRSRISANWHVTKPVIGDRFYSDQQRVLIKQVVKGVTSDDGYKRLVKQTEDDDGGLDFYSIAVFGTPGEGKFEFELTGRHLTLRADGDSVDHAAFGGPIVYGHGEEAPSENLYHYQTKQTNKVFEALDAPQRGEALLRRSPRENEAARPVRGGRYPGIRVGDLTADQRELVDESLQVLLAPYRQEDIDEVMQLVKANGGVDALHMAFYEQGDLNRDRVWDVWHVEGPGFVWHFRGAPHVHAYINIGGAKG